VGVAVHIGVDAVIGRYVTIAHYVSIGAGAIVGDGPRTVMMNIPDDTVDPAGTTATCP